MIKKLTAVFASITIFVMSFSLLVTNTLAAEGTLSFSPTSLTFAKDEVKTVSIIYTGTEITAAEIHINVGPGLEITNFTEGSGLIFIIDSPENGEVHVGKLSEGNITTGSTLLTMDVKAVECDQSGSISYNSSEVLVPDVSMSFSSATYTIDCGGGGGAAQPTSSVPNILPKTAIISEEFDKILMASFIISSGLGIAYYTKMHRGMSTPTTELIIKS